MPCYAPVTVTVRRTPGVPGHRGSLDELEVGCGKCLGCRSDQARQWAIRMHHQSQIATSSYFVTLTYSDENMPEGSSLEPDHLKSFWKKLRQDRQRDYAKRFPKLPMGEINRRASFQYYACGEYGPSTLRPHYHLALYSLDLLDLYPWRDSDSGPVFRSPYLESHWQLGNVEVSKLGFGASAYIAGYVREKLETPINYDRVDPTTGETWEVQPIFARMSRNPAIGLEWLKRFWSDVYPRDLIAIQGRESKPPRYYDRVMEDHKPDQLTIPKHELPGISYPERLEMMFNVKTKRIEEYEPLTAYHLEALKREHQARMKLFTSRNKL